MKSLDEIYMTLTPGAQVILDRARRLCASGMLRADHLITAAAHIMPAHAREIVPENILRAAVARTEAQLAANLSGPQPHAEQRLDYALCRAYSEMARRPLRPAIGLDDLLAMAVRAAALGRPGRVTASEDVQPWSVSELTEWFHGHPSLADRVIDVWLQARRLPEGEARQRLKDRADELGRLFRGKPG